MSEPSEPIITSEELMDRQRQIQDAIGKVVNEMHVKLGITSSEAVAALTAVSYGVSLKQAMTYWEIPTTEAPETAP
jgi:hypothetical protein